MKVDVYEKAWLVIAAVMIAGFLAAIVFGAGMHAIHPPSHMETIDPLRVKVDSEFANPGVFPREDGGVDIIAIAEMFTFQPSTMTVPQGKPVRIRLTSPDVLHGFQIVGTNANVMAIPGYVTELTLSFPKAGEYLILCNEYCGLSHHLMHGKLIVEGGAP